MKKLKRSAKNGLLLILFGSSMIGIPEGAVIGITLVLIYFLLFDAVTRGVLAFKESKGPTRRWLVASSFTSLGMGIYLLTLFPLNPQLNPIILLGIDLVFYGVSLTLDARSLRKEEIKIDTIEQQKKAA